MKLFRYPSIIAIRAWLASPETTAAVAILAVTWGMGVLLRSTSEARREYTLARADLESIGPVLHAREMELAGLDRRITERIADLSTYPPAQGERIPLLPDVPVQQP